MKVACCGVCPTDIKKIKFGTVPPPRVFGHETAGVIARVGGLVRGFRVGERVALHHHVPCMDCHACRHRSFAQCAQYKRTGITAGFEPAGGGYAEYVRVMPFVLPGVVKIPARNAFEEGAMLEPVNTVLKGIRRLNLLPGDHVLVIGQGPIGLLFTRLLKIFGMNVTAADMIESRLSLAKKIGARWTITADDLGRASAFHFPVEGFAQKISDEVSRGEREEDEERKRSIVLLRERRGLRATPSWLLCGSPPVKGKGKSHRALDAAIITAPSDAAVRQAQQLIRGGGQVLLFAHTKRGGATEIDLSSVCVDERDLIGSYSSDFTLQKEAARVVFSRRLDVRPLITHRFPLEQTAAAIELAAAGGKARAAASPALKIFISGQ